MSIEVEGLFLSLDHSTLITEKIAKKLFVNLDYWITPYGYYNQLTASIICNEYIPDGTYIILGKTSYPGEDRMSCHEVYQFMVAKNRGIDLILYKPLNKYPQLPTEIPLNPYFPMYRIGDLKDYRKSVKIFKEIEGKYLTLDQLTNILNQYPLNTVEGKLYRLRLALEKFINKEF